MKFLFPTSKIAFAAALLFAFALVFVAPSLKTHAQNEGFPAGRYYALIIGNNAYQR